MTILFARRQIPPEIIRHAWPYARFTLSYRDGIVNLSERRAEERRFF
jgi:hypothetical protein